MEIELTWKGDKIISVKRLSDSEIFKLGDQVNLIHSKLTAGLDEIYYITEFQAKEGGNKWFQKPIVGWPIGTIITNHGIIEIKNVMKVPEGEREIWDIPFLSLRELDKHFPFFKMKDKKITKLKELAKQHLK